MNIEKVFAYVKSPLKQIINKKRNVKSTGDIDRYIETHRTNGGIYRFSEGKDYFISPDALKKYKKLSLGTKGSQQIAEQLGLLNVNRSGMVVEVGCGIGRLSAPLIASGYFSNYLITDATESLVVDARSRLELLENSQSSVKYGVLMIEDVKEFPDNSIEGFFLAACLHHFIDWQKVLQILRLKLKPGGVIFLIEPCFDSVMFMSSLLLSYKAIIEKKGESLDKQSRIRFQNYLGALKLRGNPFATGKERFEDKHIFTIADVYKFGQDSDMRVVVFPDSSDLSFNSYGGKPKRTKSLHKLIKGRLTNVSGFSEEFAHSFLKTMKEQIDYLEYFVNVNRPPFFDFAAILQKKS